MLRKRADSGLADFTEKKIALAPHLLVNESIQSVFISFLSSALQIRVCRNYLAPKNLIFLIVPGGRAQPAVLPGPGDSVQALRAARAHILLLTPPRPSALHTILQGLHEGIHNVNKK
jgi:hypothetical protein